MELVKPKTITLKNIDGGENEFIISRLPATVSREVMAKYPIANMPKVGNYAVSEEVMLLLLGYAAVNVDGAEIRLTTKALIDNHVYDGVQQLKLEAHMIDYNTGFFGLGGSQGFLDFLLKKASQSIMPMLTRLLDQLSAQNSPPSQN